MQINYPNFLFTSAKRHKKLVENVNYYSKFSYNKAYYAPLLQNTLKNNLSAKNCTFLELRDFLEQTKIDRIQYKFNSFDCKDYATFLHNEAESAGIRAGFVAIEYSDGSLHHTCNCFKTTDIGLIFIDACGVTREIAQDERFVKIAQVKKRKRQNFVDMFGKKQYAITPKVKRFSIVW